MTSTGGARIARPTCLSVRRVRRHLEHLGSGLVWDGRFGPFGSSNEMGAAMPATYWLPLPNMRGPARVEHLHAAFSRWFDQRTDLDEPAASGEGDPPTGHHDNVKPYRLAPMSQHDGRWGVEISVLSESAFHALADRVSGPVTVQLGGVETVVDTPVVVRGESWGDLLGWAGETGWRVEFLTPFTSRTGSRSSPFPNPPVMLRAAVDAWAMAARWGAIGEADVPPSIPGWAYRDLWVSAIDVTTTTYTINGHRHPGALGSISFGATADVAALAAPLFRLAHYCGMGSFRGKGMGVVSVEQVFSG